MGEDLTTIIEKHVVFFNIKKATVPHALIKLVSKLFSPIELYFS